MSRLGVIFAGGRSRRFGSDKAIVHVGGVALIERVAAALRPQCDMLAVVGRDWGGLPCIHDRPVAGLGPLGALAGALDHGARHGFDQVLTSGCDLPDVPPELAVLLTPGPAVIAGQPLLGLWPAALAGPLLAHLDAGGSREMRGWVAAARARAVQAPYPIANLNTREELEAYEATRPAPLRGRGLAEGG